MKDIIKILQQNARISNAALGEMLGISAEEAAAKIEKLEKDGVIKGYSVIVDTIMMYDEVESVSLMSSGAYDLAVEVKGNDLKDVAFFVSERLATIDGILSTSTHFILKKYKEKGIFIDGEEPDERGLG